MITVNEIQAVLFSNDAEKNSLTTAMNREGHNFSEVLHFLLFEADELSLQKKLAPFLRQAAVKHLKDSPACLHWRNAFTGNIKALNSFLTQQNKPGVHAADDSALALAQLFNFSLQITTKTSENVPYGYSVHTADQSRPVFQIYNIPNHHWYIHDGSPDDTCGDGNCLFNSFAQLLRYSLLGSDAFEQASNRLKKPQDAEPDMVDNFFKYKKIYEKQAELIAGFKKSPPRSMDDLVASILRLSKEESRDHSLALEVAVEQGGITNADGTSHQEGKKDEDNPKSSQEVDELSQAVDKLTQAIQEMSSYGKTLKLKNQKEGQVAMDLAEDLCEMLKKARENKFYEQSVNEISFSTFQTNFKTRLNSKNAEMSKYRFTWDAILLNIAVALTGVGLLVLAGKLIYSKMTEGHALLFFQKASTMLEGKVKKVEELMHQVVDNCSNQKP